MKTPADLAARLRKMVLAAQHHYSPTGEPLRSIVVTPEWLEDMADAANALAGLAPVSVWRNQSITFNAPVEPWREHSSANALDAAPAAQPVAQVMSWGERIDCGIVQWLAHTGQPLKIGQLLYASLVAPVAQPTLDELTQKFGDLPEVSGKVVSDNKI